MMSIGVGPKIYLRGAKPNSHMVAMATDLLLEELVADTSQTYL
jgi:hypothetical protein